VFILIPAASFEEVTLLDREKSVPRILDTSPGQPSSTLTLAYRGPGPSLACIGPASGEISFLEEFVRRICGVRLAIFGLFR